MKRPGFVPGLFLFKELPRRIWINRCVTPVDFGPMICGVEVRDIIRGVADLDVVGADLCGSA